MTTTALTARNDSVIRTIAIGGFIVGTLDITYAMIFYGFFGITPVRIFQSVASGLLGRDAFTGGTPVAILGLALHYLIATIIVTVYCLVARRVTALARNPWLWGPLYGIVAYLVMNFVVVPLSAAGPRMMTLPAVIGGLLIHMFGIGTPSALTARHLYQSRSY